MNMLEAGSHAHLQEHGGSLLSHDGALQGEAVEDSDFQEEVVVAHILVAADIPELDILWSDILGPDIQMAEPLQQK